MSKKKNEKKCKGVTAIAIPWPELLGLAEAIMYDGDIEECLEGVEEEEIDSTDEWLIGRDQVFATMTERELEAYDLIETFVNSEKAGLPDDDRSLEARLEHAEWNNDDLRGELVHVLAAFEAAVAYYTTVSTLTPNRKYDIADELEEIQVCIDEIVKYARELELLTKIERAEFRMDEASKELDDAFEEREILGDQLEALYAEFTEEYDDDDDDEEECEEIDVQKDLDI